MPKEKEVFNIAEKFGLEYDLPMSKEMKAEMAKHQEHYKLSSKLDGKTVPYSVMDDKHIGKR